MDKVGIFLSGGIKDIFENIFYKTFSFDENVRFFFCINKRQTTTEELDEFINNIDKTLIIDDRELQICIKDFSFQDLPSDCVYPFESKKIGDVNVYDTCSMFYCHWINYKNICEYSLKYNIFFRHILHIYSDIKYKSVDFLNYRSADFLIPNATDSILGINVKCCYMPFEFAKIYCSVYNHMYTYVSVLKCIFHPEKLILFHFLKYNVIDKIIRFPLEIEEN